MTFQSCDPESRGDEDTLYDGGDKEDLEEQGHPPEGTNGQLLPRCRRSRP
jgi:hypothetical protein